MDVFYFTEEEERLIKIYAEKNTSRRKMMDALIHGMVEMDPEVQEIARQTLRKIAASQDAAFAEYLEYLLLKEGV
jgi:translation initiation factor 1 (eIF-1/SUI1)